MDRREGKFRKKSMPVHINCPQTCDTWSKDNSQYEIINNLGATKKCGWLGQNIQRQLKYCDAFNSNELVRHMCPVSCDFCQNVVPSREPSVVPSNDPSSPRPQVYFVYRAAY
jgi:hypothetical protein